MDRAILSYGATIAVLSLGIGILDAGQDPTTHPNPLPLSVIRPDHPRIWFNSENVHLLRQRWTDPAYDSIVNKYKGKSDAVSMALEGLATFDEAKCSQAAETVGSEYSPDGDSNLGHVDPISLVFDWCYDYLDPGQKADLISKIVVLRDQHRDDPSNGVRNFFRWHGTYLKNSFAYLASVLAIEGEPGVTSELREAQNVLQNLQELGDEVRGDGGYRAYFSQGNLQTLPFLMWTYATDTDFAMESGFTRNLAKWAAYKLAPSRRGFVRGPGDDVALESGYLKLELDAGGFYLLASHFDDPMAQMLGNLLVSEFGQGRHWNFEGPSFISLIHHKPEFEAETPAQLGMPLTAFFDKIGMVHARSSWKTDSDVVHSWFFNGPAVEHSGQSQNHYTIWRGDDPLIMKGGNYLGSPSAYKNRYHARTISNNSLLFSPMGSDRPDNDGGQDWSFVSLDVSAEKYPVADRVGSWRGQHRYRGEIIHFKVAGQYMLVSGDAAVAYNPVNVFGYVRDFVYLKPEIFLIRDRFSTSGVATIRSLIHSRYQPIVAGTPVIVEGDSTAGILEIVSDRFRLQNGASEAGIDVLWPADPTLRFVGGVGYEGYADGYNADPATDSQDWLHGTAELEERTRLIEGQWRTEIEVEPSQADGNLIQSIFVSAREPEVRPSFSVREEGRDLIVIVTHDRRTWIVVFPEDDVPTVTQQSPAVRRPTRAPLMGHRPQQAKDLHWHFF